MKLRKFQKGDGEQISKLHNGTVREICGKDYSQEEIEAWSPVETDFDKMEAWLEKFISFVVEEEDKKIIGFASMSLEGKMVKLYTHKDYQGKGVGSLLLEKLEEEAKNLKLEKITLETTKTAKTFYESKGYKSKGFVTIKFKRREIKEELMEKVLR